MFEMRGIVSEVVCEWEGRMDRAANLFSYLDRHPGVRTAALGTYMIVMCLLLVGLAWY